MNRKKEYKKKEKKTEKNRFLLAEELKIQNNNRVDKIEVHYSSLWFN